IETRGPKAGLHLHMYGMSLEHLPERITFAEETGGKYWVYPPNPGIATPVVSPDEVRAMLRDGGEMALIDVREEGVFSEEGHPFFANSVPLSRLELMIHDLVPRMSARVVVHDGGPGALDGEDLAERAALRLGSMGYRDVAVMAG